MLGNLKENFRQYSWGNAQFKKSENNWYFC